MKFDEIIIGGGLSGLVCGIQLAKANKKVAVVAAGQSTLHFNSGSLDLLGNTADGDVKNPLQELAKLDAKHPYQKVGAEKVEALAEVAKAILLEAGLKVQGEASCNQYRLTPMGILKPTWLTLDDYFTVTDKDDLKGKKVLVANIAGMMDFPQEFVVVGLKKLEADCVAETLVIPALKERRQSPSEMRSTNVAKVLQAEDSIDLMAQKLNEMSGDADLILLPAIFDLADGDLLETLRSKVSKPIFVVATLPPSVPGMRMQTLLRRYFTQLGGTFLMSDKVVGGEWENGKLKSVETSNLPDEKLYAEQFVLATGSFQSEGLQSNYESVYEPIFNFDVDAAEGRPNWINQDVYAAQPYMEFGVRTNSALQVLKDGQVVENVYAVGSVLSGHNPIKMADAQGVSMITALAVANTIIK